MESAIARPKNAFEKVILKKYEERISKIQWGENCDTVKQALTLPEEWLVGDIWNETLKEEFLEYLFKEGFVPYTVINARKKTTEWFFPANSENPFFIEIRNAYKAFFDDATRFYQEKAIEVIKYFTENEITVQGYEVSNSIYREALLNNISLYNQTILVTKNSGRYNEQREYLYFTFTQHGNVLFLGKDNNFSEFLFWADDAFNRNFATKTKSFLNYLHHQLTCYAYKPYKLITYMEKAYYEEFKELMKTIGFQVALMPRYMEKCYLPIGKREEEDIPIYIEVGKLEYRSVSIADGDVTQLLKMICKAYNH